jgi:hypothetical protein
MSMNGCGRCGGPLVELEALGLRTWYRCRDCGMDQSTPDPSITDGSDGGWADLAYPNDQGVPSLNGPAGAARTRPTALDHSVKER